MKSSPWWKEATIYQIYPRSFFDSNGDGEGDLQGITSKLQYVQELGVDAIWLSPFYTSPNKDGGYDVADPRDVDPRFGNLEDAKKLIEVAHSLGLKVLVDVVPNHFSDQHVWFQQALKAGRGSPERARFHFHDPKADGTPPNNWISLFGGPSWTQVEDGQYYLHLFDSSQPDFDWKNEEVRAEFDSVLRFWLDRGAAGFRIDVAHGMIKVDGLPDVIANNSTMSGQDSPDAVKTEESQDELIKRLQKENPFWGQEGVHEINRRFRKILDEYDDRVMCGEAWVLPLGRMAKYVRPDEYHQTFNFGYLETPWNKEKLQDVVTESLTAFGAVGAPSTWVLSNHDVIRHATRMGYDQVPKQGDGIGPKYEQPDEAKGLRRARAATGFMLGLPGGAYIYQGEELAVPEVRDIPEDRLTDPIWKMSEFKDRGRDGCRVPIAWKSSPAGAFGFSINADLQPDQAWLPQSPWWGS